MQIQSLNGYNTNFEKMGKAGKALGRVGKRKPSPYQNKAEKLYNQYMHEVQNACNSCIGEKDVLKQELDYLSTTHKNRIDEINKKPIFNGKLPFEA